MKKLLSILLVFSMLFTVTTGFAATAPKKTAAVSTTFAAISDIYGVWVTKEKQMLADKTGLYLLTRAPGTMTFTTSYMTDSLTPFKLSKDKKVITATWVSYENDICFDIQFKKDSKGKIIFGNLPKKKFIEEKIINHYKTRADFEKAQAADPAIYELIQEEMFNLALEIAATDIFENKISKDKPLIGKFCSPNDITADFSTDKLVLTSKGVTTEFKLDYVNLICFMIKNDDLGLTGEYTMPVTYTFKGKECTAILTFVFDLNDQLYFSSFETIEEDYPSIFTETCAEEAQPYIQK